MFKTCIKANVYKCSGISKPIKTILTRSLSNLKGDDENDFKTVLNADKFPKNIKVVVCGGGVLGAAVAYHLADLGLGHDTIVLEQGRLVFVVCSFCLGYPCFLKYLLEF